MLRRIIMGRIDAAERRLGESLDYARHIVRTSLPAFFKFAKLLSLAEYRRRLPADAYRVARIVATRDADCGTCVQIEVNLAKDDALPASVIQAVIDARPDDLPKELADVYRFAEAVATSSGDEDAIRERIRQRYGDEALIEMALAMAACRAFPIVKRTLGYATSCSRVQIAV